MTSRLSVVVLLLHCFFSAASVGLLWPFGTGVLLLGGHALRVVGRVGDGRGAALARWP